MSTTITRDELITELKKMGHDVKAGQILHWQEVGAIPYGERVWRDGRSWVDYPGWMPHTIADLIKLKDAGLSLKEIANRRFFVNDGKTHVCPICNGTGKVRDFV